MGVPRPSRVVIVNDRSTRVGGASNLAILSAELFERMGIPVTFLAGDAGGSEKPVHDTVNLGCKPLTEQGRASALTRGLYNDDAYRQLSEIISTRDTSSTIYHVHGWSKILSPAIFRALSGVRERVVLHAHDYFLTCPNGGYANYRRQDVCSLTPMSLRCLTTQCDKRGYSEKLWRSARHALREHLYPTRSRAANIVIVHEKMRAYFADAGVDTSRIETIRNPVEPFLTQPCFPWESRDFVFVGRLEPEKGIEDAVRAARQANVTLHVVGDGSCKAELERDYPEVIFHGWLSKAEIKAIVSRARVVVAPSRVPEPFGLAILEAVASGMPVIAPAAALLGEEIVALGCGLSARNGDLQSLTDAMKRMACDDGMIRRMSENCLREGRSLAHTESSWSAALLGLYDRVLVRANGE